jgi:hypothetical protein
MIAGRIILTMSIFVARCELLSQALADDPAATFPSTTASSATQANCPPCLPPGPCTVLPPTTDCGPPACVTPMDQCVMPGEPCVVEPTDSWIQPCPPMEAFPMQGLPMQLMPSQAVPLMPLPMSASPRPAPLGGPLFAAPPPGSIIMPPGTAPVAAEGPLANIAPGGAISPQFGLPSGPEPLPGIANPILVPVTDDQLAWDQIVDVVSGYFHVTREQQARRSGDAWSEGRIETIAQSGATLLEPQRGDSVGWFNLWESTFQSIRRTAVIRVIPDPNGYLVEVVVQKELEDLPQPEKSTIGSATLRHEGALPSHRIADVGRTAQSPRWISQGRDPALEQRMLADIHARLTGVSADGSIFR